MNHNYQQQGFQSYYNQSQEIEPQDSENFDSFDRGQGRGRGGFGWTPIMLGVGVVTTCVAIVLGLWAMSSPSTTAPSALPVVQAESEPFRVSPQDAGGMQIANADSKLFDALDQEKADVAPPTNTALQDVAQTQPAAGPDASAPVTPPATTDTTTAATAAPVQDLLGPDGKPAANDNTAATTSAATTTPPIPTATIPPELPATTTTPTAPDQLHAAATAPETMAFVRSELDKASSETASTNPDSSALTENPPKAESKSSKVAKVEPAAGAAKPVAVKITPGTYYAQLASVPSEQNAHATWSKIQRDHIAILQDSGYRLNRADLGERGVYFRVQAGPMSKDSARQVCAAFKAKKAGGCLVVQ